MVAAAKYKDLCTASYYGDVKMMKKLVEAEVEGDDAGEEKDEAALERIEAMQEGRVNTFGKLTTYANQVRHKAWGFSFHLEPSEAAGEDDVFGHQFKCSSRAGEEASPLHWAALGGEAEAVEYLLRKGAKTDVTVTPFRATPMDVARVNMNQKLLDLMVSEEMQVLQQLEGVKVELQEDFEELVAHPEAHQGCLKTVADIVLPSQYYNNKFMAAALAADRAEARRETGAATFIAMDPPTPVAEGDDAPSEDPSPSADLGDLSLKAVCELLAKLPVSLGRLALLAKTLKESKGGDHSMTSLLCAVLTSAGGAEAKALFEADPEAEAEYPDVYAEALVHQPPPPAEEAGEGDEEGEKKPPAPVVSPYAGVDAVLAAACAEAEKRQGYLFIKEPEEKFFAMLKGLAPGTEEAPAPTFSLGKHATVSCSEEQAKQAIGEGGSGVLLVFDAVDFGLDLAALSRFPFDSPFLLPQGTRLTCTKVETPPAEPPPEPEEGQEPPPGPPPVTVLTITLTCSPPEAVAGPGVLGDALLEAVLSWLAKKQQARDYRLQAEHIRNPPPPPAPEGGGDGEEGGGEDGEAAEE
eukprot:TRINITY_DN1037_c0_g4_i1.p1 TRINITY_DN1037_c0_g4~~TRINITY_DN1037_c0_g4_i1.p1  ORF type:complete len:579 (+),score=284.60 TRINITY_DN1037_c0_g4_i1:1300-3036(+)